MYYFEIDEDTFFYINPNEEIYDEETGEYVTAEEYYAEMTLDR